MKRIRDLRQGFIDNYDYIVKMVKFKAKKFDLDYDDTLNVVLGKICKDDYKVIRSFRGASKFTTFLTVVINNIIYRHAKKRKIIPDIPTQINETPLDFLLNQQKLENQDLFSKNLNVLLDELHYKEKLVVKMTYFKGLKISQTSKILGISRYQVQKHLNSGLQVIRKKIEEITKN